MARNSDRKLSQNEIAFEVNDCDAMRKSFANFLSYTKHVAFIDSDRSHISS